MKTSLLHLPLHKQEQIMQVAEVIKEITAPEKIILFGSYAKGTWVEDRYNENGIRYEYISDYDFLVVTKDRQEKDYVLVDKIVNRTRNMARMAINPIIHEIDYVNEGLAIGQYFFTDIINEGIILYDTNKFQFAEPRQLTLLEQKEIAEGNYKEWFSSGSEFILTSKDSFSRSQLKIAAFLLHQAAERFYNTVLLVFTGYKPKTHSLEKLRQFAKPLSEELFAVFPSTSSDKYEHHLFDLLKRGYIDARYKHDYVITTHELEALIQRVQKMQEIVHTLCTQKISSFITS